MVYDQVASLLNNLQNAEEKVSDCVFCKVGFTIVNLNDNVF